MAKWSGHDYGVGKRVKPGGGDAQSRAMYVEALRSRAPGQWTDNRLEQSKHLVGAVYVAVKVLADQAAACQIKAYQRLDDAAQAEGQDDKDALPVQHPLSRLMRRPNPKETMGMLLRRMVQQICLTGTALDWRLVNGLGDPAELWCLPTGICQWTPRSAAYPEGAYRVAPYFSYGSYPVAPALMTAGGVVVPAEEVIRVDYPHPLVQWDAYSPLTACNLQLDALEAIDRSRWYSMQRAANPSGVVKLDPSVLLPDQQELDRMKLEYERALGGPHNSGRIAVLSPGAELLPWQGAGKEIGWTESWGQLVDFVLSVFGTTKTLAFMAEGTNYASLYASLKQFNLLSLTPLLRLIGDALNVQLVWPTWGEGVYVELEPAAIDDDDQKMAKVDLLAKYSAATINEMRVILGLEPVDWGEERVSQTRTSVKDPTGAMLDADPATMAGEPADGEPAEAPDPGEQSEGSLPERIAKHLHNGVNGHG